MSNKTFTDKDIEMVLIQANHIVNGIIGVNQLNKEDCARLKTLRDVYDMSFTKLIKGETLTYTEKMKKLNEAKESIEAAINGLKYGAPCEGHILYAKSSLNACK